MSYFTSIILAHTYPYTWIVYHLRKSTITWLMKFIKLIVLTPGKRLGKIDALIDAIAHSGQG